MSSKQPVIKFSPFEALLIGEKNRILKRQPMRNTIFVTRLNRRSKAINLRDLFGLEKSAKSDNDPIFKMPQRVCDFLKNRRLESKTNKRTSKVQDEILCYEFEGCKMITKANENVVLRGKNKKEKLNKVKFKNKFKFRDKVVKKFPNPIKRRYFYDIKTNGIVLKQKRGNRSSNRHLLRGKDGKFIRKSELEKLNSKEISPKQKYLSNYLHQLYLKKNKELFNISHCNKDDNELFQTPYSIGTIVGLPNSQFDISASEALLNKVSLEYYKNNCHEDFQFPTYPNHLKPSDFENDVNLLDIIYEKFPSKLKFESKPQINDFTDALLGTEILNLEKNYGIYEKSKSVSVKDEDIRKILDKRFPLIKLEKISDIIIPNHFCDKNEGKIYASEIEPYTSKSHLGNGKSVGSLFFRSSEGEDIFIGNLMKPFLRNSWFNRLSNT